MADGSEPLHVQPKKGTAERSPLVDAEIGMVAQDELDFRHHKNGAYAKFQEDLLGIPASDVRAVAQGLSQKDNGHSLVEEFNSTLRISEPGQGQRSRGMQSDFAAASKAVQTSFGKYDEIDDKTIALKQENDSLSNATQLADSFFRTFAPGIQSQTNSDQGALDKVMTRPEQTAMQNDFVRMTQMESALKDAHPEQFAQYQKMRDQGTPVAERDRLHHQLLASQPDLVNLRDSYNRRFIKAYDQIEAMGNDQNNMATITELRFAAHANYAQALLEGNGSAEAAKAQLKLAFQNVPRDQFRDYAGNPNTWAMMTAMQLKPEDIPNPDY